jgi:hypothetical protein
MILINYIGPQYIGFSAANSPLTTRGVLIIAAKSQKNNKMDFKIIYILTLFGQNVVNPSPSHSKHAWLIFYNPEDLYSLVVMSIFFFFFL